MIDRGRADIRYLRWLFESGSVLGVTDGELLNRYLTREGDEAEFAFAALVERHGAMVLRVCRGVLANSEEVQDAFQATFLVLVRRAHSIRKAESLASWLHGVALRVASSARGNEARRRAHERRAASLKSDLEVEPTGADLEGLIQEALSRLPERYRLPVVLCDLGGLTHEQAAQTLGCPVGTVKSRLSRGRERLRGYLVKRGLAPAAVALGIAARDAVAAVPSNLVSATVRLANCGGVATSIPGAIESLASHTIRDLPRTWLGNAIKATAVVVAIAGAVVYARTERPPRPPVVPPKPVVAARVSRPNLVVQDALRRASLAVRSETDVGNRLAVAMMIADAQIKTGDITGAKETIGSVTTLAEGLTPVQRCSGLTMAAWVKSAAGDSKGGLEDLRRAKEAAGEIERQIERYSYLEWIAKAQFDLGDRAAAEATVRLMAESVMDQIRRNEPTNGTCLIAARTYLGDFKGAFAIVNHIARGSEQVMANLQGRMAIATINREVMALQPRRRFSPSERQDRMKVLDRIEQYLVNTPSAGARSIADLALARADFGDLPGALRLASKLREDVKSNAPFDKPGAVMFLLSQIGEAQAKAGQFEEARATLRETLALFAESPALRAHLIQIASAQVSARDVSGFSRSINLVAPDASPNELAEYARLCAEIGDMPSARAMYHRALDSAEKTARAEAATGRGGFSGASGQPVVWPPYPGDSVDANKAAAQALVVMVHAKMGEHEAATRAFEAIGSPPATVQAALGMAAYEVAKARAGAGDIDGALVWALALKTPQCRIAGLSGLVDGIEARRERTTR